MPRTTTFELSPVKQIERWNSDVKAFAEFIQESTPPGTPLRSQFKLLVVKAEEFLRLKDWDEDPMELATRTLQAGLAYRDPPPQQPSLFMDIYC